MANIETKNLYLVISDENDAYNVSVFNNNFQLIDEAMENVGKGTEDLTKLQTNDKTSLVNAINEVFQSGGDVKQKFEKEVDPTKCVVILNGSKKDSQDGSVTFAIHNPYLKEITSTGLKVGFHTSCSREEGDYSWQVIEFC